MIERVCISGGTHGNELIGVYLVREWLKRPECVQRSSFTTELLISNPRAVEKCVRYIDLDLNRQFTPSNLQGPESAEKYPYEVGRAREIEATFGGSSDSKRIDFWLDVHTTTSNMGTCLLLSKNDPFTLGIGASVQSKFGKCVRMIALPSVSSSDCRSRSGGIIDTGSHGIGLELGPLAHGTLNATLYKQSEDVIHYVLDLIHKFNMGTKPEPAEDDIVELFEPFRKVDFPRDNKGNISAMFHPNVEGKNWEIIYPGDPLFITFNGVNLPYDGQEPVYAIFVNEASYMEKGTALLFARKVIISLSSTGDKQLTDSVQSSQLFT